MELTKEELALVESALRNFQELNVGFARKANDVGNMRFFLDKQDHIQELRKRVAEEHGGRV